MSDIKSTYGGKTRLRDRVPTRLVAAVVALSLVAAIAVAASMGAPQLVLGDDDTDDELNTENPTDGENQTDDQSDTRASVGVSVTQTETDSVYEVEVYVYRLSGVEALTVDSKVIDEPITMGSFGSETVSGLSVGDTVTVSWADVKKEYTVVESSDADDDTELEPETDNSV